MDIVRYKGAYNEIQNSFLLVAAEAGDVDEAQFLLEEQGASVRAKDLDGQTALNLAVLGRHEGMVRLLLEKGANIEESGQYGNKPLYIATAPGNREMVELLLQFNANIESFNTKHQKIAL
jgi:serine/threonine-protein phosphatase 6 regulatory ankyrin repeat subunit B